MSIAQQYGKPSVVDAETMKQVHSAGRTLAANGVKHDQALSETAPTPAQKFGSPNNNQVMKSKQVHGERSHALTPDSNLGQQRPSHGRSL